MAHVRTLSVDIGPRVSGSDAAEATVAYISETLRGYGYAVEVMEFTYGTLFRSATITIDGERVDALALSGVIETPPLEGPAYGEGSPAGATADGAIMVATRSADRDDQALLDRAADAGAAGLVIVNREGGPIYGFLRPGDDPTPVVLAPHTEAERLARAVAEGRDDRDRDRPRQADGRQCDRAAGGGRPLRAARGRPP